MNSQNNIENQLREGGITFLGGCGILRDLPEVLAARGVGRAFLFADENTYAATGNSVVALLNAAGIETKAYRFSASRLEPNESAVGLAMMHFDPSVDAVIGVGSGVINDISKIVANIAGKLYAIVATAPSMDGYASATSSMSVGGLKVSLSSKCADIIVGDTDVLRNAPMEMLLSGLGDILAKYVAICEWRISALINGEPFRADVADMVRTSLQTCVENADGLLRRDETATAAVFEGLVLCGAAMKMAGCSRPASGVEHYLSHIWDMRGEEFGTPVALHGIQCAVGTYIAVGMYEKLRRMTPDRSRALAYAEGFDYSAWAKALQSFLGRGADAMIALEQKEKKYDVSKHGARLERILENWDGILAILDEELPPLSMLTALYNKAGLPKRMSEIGIDETVLPMSFKATKDIRNKYVLSHLCHDLGVVDEMLGE